MIYKYNHLFFVIHHSFYLFLLLIEFQCKESRLTNSYSHGLELFSKPRSISKVYSSNESKEGEVFASKSERRKEEKRRLERKEDVVIGKTSAIPDEVDFEIDASKTEAILLETNDLKEKEVIVQTNQGLDFFRMLQLEKARKSFDRVYELKENAYIFQAGITLFYLDEIEMAGNVFVKSGITYETKFGLDATEERIWRDICELTLLSRMTKKEIKLANENNALPVIPVIPSLKKSLETRKVLKLAYKLCRASIQNNMFEVISYRAKLFSIAIKGKLDTKRWKFHSWYFLGLHYDAIGNTEQSRFCMKRAMMLSQNDRDIMNLLPLLHMCRRDWFDDDDITEQKELQEEFVIHILTKDSQSVKLADIQQTLKSKGIKFYEKSKHDLQKRFLELLLDEFYK